MGPNFIESSVSAGTLPSQRSQRHRIDCATPMSSRRPELLRFAGVPRIANQQTEHKTVLNPVRSSSWTRNS